MGNAAKLGRMNPGDELVLRLIVDKPRQQSEFPRLWEEMSNPARVKCERAMKACGRQTPGVFNGWGAQVRLAQKKLVKLEDVENDRGKLVPMFVATPLATRLIEALDKKQDVSKLEIPKEKAARGKGGPKKDDNETPEQE